MFRLIYAIRGTVNGIKSAFVNGPRRALLYTVSWILLGICCGLFGVGNEFGFFNVASGFFFVIAGLLLILALVKYFLWRRDGLREVLPDGTVLVAIGNTGETQGGYSHLSINGNGYVLPVPPVATGIEPVTLPCPACQEELTFDVASLQARKSRRLNLLLTALITFLIGVAINIFFSPLFPVASQGWVFWVRLVGYIFLFVSGIFFSGLIQYTGVSLKRVPGGHTMLPVLSANLVEYRDRQRANVQAYGQGQF